MAERPYPIPGEVCKISLADQVSNPRLWNGFEFGNPSRNACYFEDFFQYVAADWTVTTVGTGTKALTNEENGVLLLTNSAADNDAITVQRLGEAFKASSGRNIWFEARIKISDATQSDLLIGLVTTDTTPLANANGIYFIKNDGVATIDFVTNASSVASTDSSIATLVADTYVDVGFKVTDTGLVEYFINGQKKGEFKTNIPTATLRVTVHIQNGEAVAKTASIDCVMIAQTRKTS